MKSLLTFINESIPYKKLNGKKLNNKTIGEFIDYANERLENSMQYDPDCFILLVDIIRWPP